MRDCGVLNENDLILDDAIRKAKRHLPPRVRMGVGLRFVLTEFLRRCC
jgi:hypothetical protein